jgi:hypothetical protein
MRFLSNVTTYTTVYSVNLLYCAFIFFHFINFGFTSIYLTQVYVEMHREVMDAILAMVFPVFHFYVIYNQFIYQFIIIIDANLFGFINQKIVNFVCQLSNTSVTFASEKKGLLGLNFFNDALCFWYVCTWIVAKLWTSHKLSLKWTSHLIIFKMLSDSSANNSHLLESVIFPVIYFLSFISWYSDWSKMGRRAYWWNIG